MPLHITAAKSSRVTKPKSANPLRKRSAVSAFSSTPRRKPSQTSRNKSVADDDVHSTAEYHLADAGIVRLPSAASSPREVAPLIKYISGRMFADIPERGAGMNSTRIAEVLNFRASLPPIVTVAHVHALGQSPTQVEREVVDLLRRGVVRKIQIPGRGLGSAALDEALVLAEDWVQLVEAHPSLERAIKDKYIALLRTTSTSSRISPLTFTPEERSILLSAGLLTSSTTSTTNTPLLSSTPSTPGTPGTLGTLTSLSCAGSQHASGTVAAAGGPDAFHAIGGSGGGILAKGVLAKAQAHDPTSTSSTPLTLALPNVGSYLKLLSAARAHLARLLSQCGPHRCTPLDALRERWDGGGGVAAPGDAVGAAKRARGEVAGVLAGRTRRWRVFCGMRFEWVVEECVGAGLVECFETGSVGVGVRAAR